MVVAEFVLLTSNWSDFFFVHEEIQKFSKLKLISQINFFDVSFKSKLWIKFHIL